jgi:hypothetical protein
MGSASLGHAFQNAQQMLANAVCVASVVRLAVMSWTEGNNISYAVSAALKQGNYVVSFQERGSVEKLKSRFTAELAPTFCSL